MTTTPAHDPEVAQFAAELGEGDWRYAGDVGVDSGQLLLCDPCYINTCWVAEEFSSVVQSDSPFSYPACCNRTLGDPGYGQLHYPMGHAGVGVVTRTGCGDGVYPVFVRLNEERRIVEMRVLMDWLDPEDDEDNGSDPVEE